MKKEWIIDGFDFATETEAMAATKELEGIRYIQERLNTNRPEAVLQVYLKLIQDDMFHTPVGLCYLKELQTILLESAFIMQEEVVPISVKQLEQKQQSTENLTQTIEKSSHKQNNEEIKISEKSRKPLLIMNIFLVITIIAMFALSATSNVPTILNYENKIINKYEQWEKELKQREDTIKQKEEQLNSQENNGDN